MEHVSLHDLMLATGGRLSAVPSPDSTVQQICTDTRQLKRGDVFWALQGEQYDGTTLSLRPSIEVPRSVSLLAMPQFPQVRLCLLVQDTGAALMQFAKWYRGTLDALVIGLTGSVGKTTTRDLIHSWPASEFEGIRSRRNFNNTIGLPLSLLDADHRHEFVVLEMGASRVGDIAELAAVATPEIGVVTAIGPAHLKTFGSLEAIIQGKGELLYCLPFTGFAVLPGDDPILRQMADPLPAL